MMKQSWTFNNRILLFLYETSQAEERRALLKQHVGETERRADGKLISLRSPLSFSVSHTENLFLIAVDPKGQPIGVDLESDQSSHDFELLARHLYSTQETEHLASLSGNEKRQWALRYWCLKEARFKMCGDSISTFPNEISISYYIGDNCAYAVCSVI
jgi:phosphopantetheinyl transferase